MMIDIFDFLRLTKDTEKEQILEIVQYLTQFKETLEFALNNISIDNLSDELIGKLNSLGADIQRRDDERIDELAQVSNKSLTISDVCNSDTFKEAVAKEVSEYTTFNVNFETGHLEYLIKVEGENG